MQDGEKQLTMAIVELSNKIETLLSKHVELAENVTKIKEAVYNPDSGLYARLRELDTRIDILEDWKNNNTKILWIVATSIIGLTAATVWRVIF